MRTLQAYLIRQVVAALAMTVAVFTFVLLLANVLREILALLVNRQIDLLSAGQAIGLLIPFVLVFALPMGMLTAALLVFGRFSAEHELTAARASGISLLALITPILLLSVAMTTICAVVNLHLAPQCRVAYKRLLFTIGLNRMALMLPEKTFIKDFPNRIVYIGKAQGTNLEDILIYNLEDDKVESYIRASSGRVMIDRFNQVIHVTLLDAWRVSLTEGNRIPWFEEVPFSYTNRTAIRTESKPKLTDMTYFQLQNELRDLERRLTATPRLPRMTKDELQAKYRQLLGERQDLTLAVRVQMHRQVAFSFACIGFTLVGIPLGIRAHRRETTFGIGIALILVLVYYSFYIFSQAVDTRPEWMPQLILWAPNFLFQAVGAVLLWRADRGI